MRNNKYIIPNKICTFDPNNHYKQSTTGLISVRVLRMVKNNLIKNNRFWEVEDIENPDNKYIVRELYLYPDGMSVVRYPLDMPAFSDEDIKCIKNISSLIEKMDADNFYTLYEKSNNKKSDVANRLKCMALKIDYYNSMRDV